MVFNQLNYLLKWQTVLREPDCPIVAVFTCFELWSFQVGSEKNVSKKFVKKIVKKTYSKKFVKIIRQNNLSKKFVETNCQKNSPKTENKKIYKTKKSSKKLSWFLLVLDCEVSEPEVKKLYFLTFPVGF